MLLLAASVATVSSFTSRDLKPAFVGDTLKPRLEVERVWRDGHKLYCRFKTSLANQDGQILLEGFHVYRVLENKPPEAA